MASCFNAFLIAFVLDRFGVGGVLVVNGAVTFIVAIVIGLMALRDRLGLRCVRFNPVDLPT